MDERRPSCHSHVIQAPDVGPKAICQAGSRAWKYSSGWKKVLIVNAFRRRKEKISKKIEEVGIRAEAEKQSRQGILGLSHGAGSVSVCKSLLLATEREQDAVVVVWMPEATNPHSQQERYLSPQCLSQCLFSSHMEDLGPMNNKTPRRLTMQKAKSGERRCLSGNRRAYMVVSHKLAASWMIRYHLHPFFRRHFPSSRNHRAPNDLTCATNAMLRELQADP